MTTGLEALRAQGELLELAGNRPFRLDQPDKFWLVLAGQVELFAVATSLQNYGRNRVHLGTALPGQALFGLGQRVNPRPFGPKTEETNAAAAGLLAVAMPNTQVLRLEISALQELVRTTEDPQRFAPLLDGWLQCLFSTTRPAAAPKGFRVLERGKELRLEEEMAARSSQGVVWFRPIQGQAFFLGREDLPIQGDRLFPLTDDTWLLGKPNWCASVLDTALLLRSGAIWEGLETFHQLFLRYVQALVREAGELERSRLQRRRQRDQAALRQAQRKLAGAITGESPIVAGSVSLVSQLGYPNAANIVPSSPDPPQEGSGEALLAACQTLGRQLGLSFHPPTAGKVMGVGWAGLVGLCQHSRVRYRRVLLRDAWWQQDFGPLLAFRKREAASQNQESGKSRNSPVGAPWVLLPSRQGYQAIEPLSGQKWRVDSELAEGLLPEAVMFYRQLPERRLDGWDLSKFIAVGIRPDLGRLFASGLGFGILALVAPWLTGHLVSRILPTANGSQLWQVGIAMVFAALAAAAFQIVRNLASLRLTSRIDSQLQAALWDRLLALPVGFFRRFSVGDLADRVLGVDALRELLTGDLLAAFLAALFSLTSLGLMFYCSPDLAWRGLLLLALLAMAGLVTFLLQAPLQTRQSDRRGRLSALLFGLLNGIAKLRVAGAEKRAYALWADAFTELRREIVAQQKIASTVQTLVLVFPLVCGLVLFTAAAQTSLDGLPLAKFLIFQAAFGLCLTSTLAMVSGLVKITAILPIYRRLRPILETAPEVRRGQLEIDELRGDFELSHVSFRYRLDGPPILEDVSFKARAGELIAIVGPSGAGKSTCLRLILGFEQPSSGSIYFDGQDLSSLHIASLRRQIGVVLQGARPIVGDIFTNIVGDHPELGVHDVWEALELVGLADEVKALPMGLFTPIGEGGGTFSGGQRQRLLIARAIVNRPRLLIFDEATSALDNQAQAAIRRSLERLKATRIVVAHRLSTIRDADHIVVLDQGRVVETGTYQELLMSRGLFYRLAARQHLVPK